MHFVGSNSQAFWDKLHKIDYLQIFQAGYFFYNEANCRGGLEQNYKSTIMSLVYPVRLASIIEKKRVANV